MLTAAQLNREIADSVDAPVALVRDVMDVLREIALDELKQGNKVKIAGIVQLEPKLRAARKARMGRNPQTGEAVKIAAKPASAVVKARVLTAAKGSTPSVQKLRAAAKK